MQSYTTILGIIDMRLKGISFDDCRSRYGVGSSTITLIMNRYKDSGKDLAALTEMSADEVELLFYSPENIRRKDAAVMPDYQAVYDRLTSPGSKANLFYLWLKYKQECPSGYQYTQYCEHFKRFVKKYYGVEAVSMVVERIPSEKVYIDWAGDQPEILVDRDQKLKEENRSLNDKLEKAYEFMKQFVIGGMNLLEKFREWIGEKFRDVESGR